MTKPNGTLRIVIAVVAALGIPAGGFAGYYKLQSDVEWACKQHNALEVRHAHDIDLIEGKLNVVKGGLETILQRTAGNQAKLDMMVEMLRELRTKDTR